MRRPNSACAKLGVNRAPEPHADTSTVRAAQCACALRPDQPLVRPWGARRPSDKLTERSRGRPKKQRSDPCGPRPESTSCVAHTPGTLCLFGLHLAVCTHSEA